MVAKEQAGGLALEQGRNPDQSGAGGSGGSRAVDILTVDDDPVFSSDDEDSPGEQLHYLDVVGGRGAQAKGRGTCGWGTYLSLQG
jgi:hypothetical protein